MFLEISCQASALVSLPKTENILFHYGLLQDIEESTLYPIVLLYSRILYIHSAYNGLQTPTSNSIIYIIEWIKNKVLQYSTENCSQYDKP